MKLYLRNNQYKIIAEITGTPDEIRQLKASRKEVPQWDVISRSTYYRESAQLKKRGAK
jgi:hypothetical protein